MKIAWFDPFSGTSGDMILGALLDAGCPIDALRAELARIPLTGYRLAVERASQHGIGGARVDVVVDEGETARDWRAIRALLEISALPDAVRRRIVAIFARLAAAEAAIHGEAVEDVHFHEVGGIDAIVDIAGAVIGLDLLGVERVYSAPPRLGAGWARSAHGQIPVPAPATAALLAAAGAPFAPEPPGEPAGELLTPTGAAILTTLATFERPAMAPSAIGYGFGRRQLPWPNALRVWIGEAAAETGDGELLVQTNLDDMNPQFLEPLLERLFAAGALDAWLEPVVMKKGRPAVVVSAICPAGRRDAVEAAFFANSTTLGVRVTAIERTKAARAFRTVATRWGDVRLKLRIVDSRV
ncbi:MAG TPA: nickel pincer cofactor biosynthesis protein LarC, partial [Thermomicrobiales bacterium]|nr:nickel pincer cofactor biosynthesis protein LarC [Thermomicrobiales bacterium]